MFIRISEPFIFIKLHKFKIYSCLFKLVPPKEICVQDEFFGVYCLVSKSDEKHYKALSFHYLKNIQLIFSFRIVVILVTQQVLYKSNIFIHVLFIIDPNRRIRQHNSGKEHGGAKKTDNKGPWYV